MGLVNLFRPKWQHTDPKVRIAALKNVRDLQILSELAENDDDHAVREAAKEAKEALKEQQKKAEAAREWNSLDPTVRSILDSYGPGSYLVVRIELRGGAVSLAEQIVAAVGRYSCKYKILTGSQMSVSGMAIADQATLVMGEMQGFDRSSAVVTAEQNRECRILIKGEK